MGSIKTFGKYTLIYFSAILLQFVYIPVQAQRTDSIAFIKPHHAFPGLMYVPSTLIVTGVALNGNGVESIKREIVEERNESIPKFHTHADDFLQISPVAIAYGLDAFGYKSKNDFVNRTAILIKGEIMMTGVVFGLKKVTHQLRPDNSAYTSFPSGHTAQAFAAATFLSEEYKGHYKWMPYLAYGIATSVGMLRMANNKHYISDVLVGAGVGILSMKLSYATHQYKWNKSYHP